MAYTWTKDLQFSSTTSGANYARMFYELKERLKTAGWTVPSSGTGTGGTYNSSGDSITSETVLNATTQAWFRLQDPSATREIIVQRGTTESTWRMKYAKGTFTGGSPAAGVTPSATTEGFVLGGGTDASPTFTTTATGTLSRGFIVANNASPYEFCLVYNQIDTSVTPVQGGAIFMDALVSGTYSSSDTDPYVVGAGFSSLFMTYAQNSSDSLNDEASNMKAYIGSVTSAAFLGVGCAAPTNNTYNQIQAVGNSPFSGKDDIIRGIWVRNNSLATPGWKGVSTLFRWCVTNRSKGATFTLSTSRDLIRVGDLVLPWDGTLPLTSL